MSRRISAHRDPQELFQNLPAELRQIVPFDGLAIVLHEESTNTVSRRVLELTERAVILSAGPVLKVPLADLQTQPMSPAAGKQETLDEAGRRTILDALQRSNWVVSGRKGSAALLGLKRTTLQWRMDKLGIRRSGSGEPGS
jgi:transcriptional regulator with GAF, ATPase, and Fis domain